MTEKLKNPATKFLEWKAMKGCFSYYDKDEKSDIEVHLPIEFSVVFEGTGIVGYDKNGNGGKGVSIYSNEIIKMDEILHVRNHNGDDLVSGKYANIKEEIKAKGGRFCKFVYAVMNDELVCFKMFGSALSWFDDTEKLNKQESIFKVEKTKEGVFIKKEKVDDKEVEKEIKYSIPVFEYSRNMTREEYKAKVDIDFDMKEYLEEYRGEKKEVKEEPKADIPAVKYESDIKPEDLPF